MNNRFLLVPVLISAMLSTAVLTGFTVSADEIDEFTKLEGPYAGQVQTCLDARKAGTTKSIKFPYCPEDATLGDYEVAYQVILDVEFQKIDKEAEAKIKGMQAKKGKDFVAMDVEIVNWFDSTSPNHEFPTMYDDACDGLLEKVVTTFKSIPTDGRTVTIAKEGNKPCYALARAKTSAYKGMGRLFATQNVVDSFKSDKKQFKDKLKAEYEKFLMKWMIYIGEMARIKDKWNEKTPKHNQG